MDNRTLDQIRRNETKLIYDLTEVEKENSKLQERIDEAIEYIKRYNMLSSESWDAEKIPDILLEILKGD